MITLADVQAALERIRHSIYLSPCTLSATFSQLTGNSIYLKLENLQMTGSFKERGALNKLLTLSAEERARGVIAASAGNHAQGVAYHAARRGIQAQIFMPLDDAAGQGDAPPRRTAPRSCCTAPTTTRPSKKPSGAAEEQGLTFIHAFDDDAVIAGQGTVGLEMLEQNPYLEAVVVPIGGGGLIGGIACAMKETNPKVQIIGVQTARLPSMKAAVAAGKAGDPAGGGHHRRRHRGAPRRRAHAAAGPEVRRRHRHRRRRGDRQRNPAAARAREDGGRGRRRGRDGGAGASARSMAGKKVAVLVGGGNIDVNMLSRIIERGLVKDGRLVRLRVHLPDYPGALHRLTGILADHRANIVETSYDRAYYGVNLGETAIDITMETRGPDQIAELLSALEAAGYSHERVL